MVKIFRQTEHAFQMLTQVSGRAGRSLESESRIIIQTYNPTEHLIKLFEQGDSAAFYNLELQNRKLLNMPPFYKMVSINLSSLSEQALNEFARKLVASAPRHDSITILGPIQPILYKLKSRYQLRIIITSKFSLQTYVKNLMLKVKIPNAIRLSLDIDPYDFY